MALKNWNFNSNINHINVTMKTIISTTGTRCSMDGSLYNTRVITVSQQNFRLPLHHCSFLFTIHAILKSAEPVIKLLSSRQRTHRDMA